MTAINDLDTPALLVDLPRLKHNISAMQSMADAAGIALRPHTKTHKSPVIARMQVGAGARGITVAKVGEAEVMVAAGFDDIFIAYPLIGDAKYQRLLPLLERARIAVAADSQAGVAAMSAFFGPRGIELPVLAELDTGFRRTGLTAQGVFQLAMQIYDSPGLVFGGVMTFGGLAYAASSEMERRAVADEEGLSIARMVEEIAMGHTAIGADFISVGSTPSMPFMASMPHVSEVRPGVYVFGDLKQVALGTMRREECALTVLATVVSNPVPGRYVLDCGTKALSSDHYATVTFGQLKDYPEAVIVRASEEHGIIEGGELPLRIGDKVEVLPNHACGTCNMHDELYAVEDGQVVDVWPVAGRGKFR